jgi:opacity protein-like surface antigen
VFDSSEYSGAIRPSVLMLLTAICLWAPLTRGQETIQKPRRPASPVVDLGAGVTFEVTPHTGLMGGSGTFGLNLLMSYGAIGLELAAEQVIGKTANLYPITVNAMLNLTTRGRLIPYGVVGAGLWLTVPTDALGAQTVSTLGLNFGGGARYFVTRSFGIRLEGRQHVTSVGSSREVRDELLFFQEITLGVTFLFH